MPAIFHRVDGEWRIERLAARHGLLSFAPVHIEAREAVPLRHCSEAIVLMRIEPGRKWAAIVPEDFALLHNGQPVPARLRVLAHGDLLAAEAAAPVFFSSEETACIETFAGTEPISCPRCKGEIARGQAVVRCPDCGVVHHELEDRNCWTYAQTCALCPQPTALETGLRWSPEAL